MRSFVDIHSHVLPGIDDGPADLVGAVAMARAAADAGTRTLVATPHLRPDFPNVHLDELGDRVQHLRAAIADAAIDLELVAGAEVSLAWALDASAQDLASATYGQRGTDLLVETPPDYVSGIENLLLGLRANKLRVTLAHPERSHTFQRDPASVAELVTRGVLLQINADSLYRNARKSPVGRLARWLCTQGLAHVIASDGHRSEAWRPVTALAEGDRAAAALVGEPRARWMTEFAPAAILAGAELPDPPPSSSPRRFARIVRGDGTTS